MVYSFNNFTILRIHICALYSLILLSFLGFRTVWGKNYVCAAKYHLPGHEDGYASLEEAMAACDDESACGCIDFECDRTHTGVDTNKKYYLAEGRKTRKEYVYNRAKCSVVKILVKT